MAGLAASRLKDANEEKSASERLGPSLSTGSLHTMGRTISFTRPAGARFTPQPTKSCVRFPPETATIDPKRTLSSVTTTTRSGGRVSERRSAVMDAESLGW
jgi:hypothetical protein